MMIREKDFHTISIKDAYNGEAYRVLPFYRNGREVRGARWGMTLKSAGSMRFRWNEQNPVRSQMLLELCGRFGAKTAAAVQLDHTKDVLCITEADETCGKIADGIITKNERIIPVVTVADCVPIFLFDHRTSAFGVVHSGWKGTGIAAVAIEKMLTHYGSKPDDICVAIGPHIHSCCYLVSEERAEYFRTTFSAGSVQPCQQEEREALSATIRWNYGEGALFRLSLLNANLAVLKKAGIPDANITYATDCTCCTPIFGSNRRETSQGSEFTVQAAFTVRE